MVAILEAIKFANKEDLGVSNYYTDSLTVIKRFRSYNPKTSI